MPMCAGMVELVCQPWLVLNVIVHYNLVADNAKKKSLLTYQDLLVNLAQYFYNVKNGSSNITSKSSSNNLSNGEVFPENWHFNSCFVLKTTKAPLFVFITEILWWTFWRNNWRSVFDVLKILRFCYAALL